MLTTILTNNLHLQQIVKYCQQMANYESISFYCRLAALITDTAKIQLDDEKCLQ